LFSGKEIQKEKIFSGGTCGMPIIALGRIGAQWLQEYALSPIDRLTFLEIIGLIPQEDLFKMNIDMSRALLV
jgi:hypothetical protein